MEKSNAIQILNSRKLVTEPGSYQLRAVSVVPFDRDGTLVNIVNFNAMTDYHLSQAKASLKAGEYQEATNFAISTSARVGRDFTPQKGQIVEVVFDHITNKDGIEALVVVGVNALATKKAAAISFDDVDEETGEVLNADKAEEAIV